MENTLTNCTVKIRGIDLILLKDQKHKLINIPKADLHDDHADALEGIINLLDAIQDYAVDELGFNAKDVFNLS